MFEIFSNYDILCPWTQKCLSAASLDCSCLQMSIQEKNTWIPIYEAFVFGHVVRTLQCKWYEKYETKYFIVLFKLYRQTL